jgi:hypothetical protein
MDIDHDKLRELGQSLTDDQRRLLREGLAGGGELDPKTLAKSLKSLDTQAVAGPAKPAVALAPLKFKKAAGASPAQGEPVIIHVDKASVTLSDVRRLAKQRSGRDLTSISEVQVLDLAPSEVTEPTLKKLASQGLTGPSATARRLVTMEKPKMSTTIGDLGEYQQGQAGTATSARLVIVVIVFGPIVIIIVGNPPPDDPPPEPPLSRW